MNKKSFISKFLFFLFMFLCYASICIILYINRNFVLIDTNPIAQILFHCIVQIDGADPAFISGIIKHCIIVPLIVSLLTCFLVFNKWDKLSKINESKPLTFIRKNCLIISAVCMIISLSILGTRLGLIDYIRTYTKSSTLYEDEYVDPAKVEYSFPDKKRNLIYIFLESVETSDYSKKEKGALDYNCIPELYQLAEENITFNNNEGYLVAPGASWTVASMIAQSSGIPLNIPIGENDFVTSNKYLPGVYSIGEILEAGGYNNELLIGSEAVFSGRKYYYEMHGNYDIHDYTYYVENGLFNEEDQVWWGFQDSQLYEYAKQDLKELSNKNEPFNLTLLTVDTHHPNGWVCEYCKDEFKDQLANVYACASRQVTEFVDWCKQQDFYDNTTIVIAGDHKSMSADFAEVIGNYDRKIYYTIINPDPSCIASENRTLSTFDLYPTTVSALGIKFEGNRLGLGTDLFSKEETLCEKYGTDAFFSMVKKHSKYYDNRILYGFE